MNETLEHVSMNHTAGSSLFYAVLEFDQRMDWAQLSAGGPLNAPVSISAGGMSSYRGFHEQLLAERG
jgi:hypothetical protein